jgi:nascent polypeptide-associated complex subunit alpha
MFPGMGGRGGGLNPRKLNQMMRQLGIEVEDIDDVEEVVIRTADREIVFRDAAVSKMIAQGQTTWQLTGTPEERPRAGGGASSGGSGGSGAAAAEPEGPLFSEEDVKLVAETARVPLDAARKALEECDGEPAEAILKLTEDQ